MDQDYVLRDWAKKFDATPDPAFYQTSVDQAIAAAPARVEVATGLADYLEWAERQYVRGDQMTFPLFTSLALRELPSADAAVIVEGGFTSVLARAASSSTAPSRKSVRAVGTLGPISPAVVMYTVARQGQHGFHQRTEYNKRILIMSNTEKDAENSINPSGGFKHFGLVKGDYIVVRGSVPGVPKRLVKMRQPIRSISKKVVEPKVLELVVK